MLFLLLLATAGPRNKELRLLGLQDIRLLCLRPAAWSPLEYSEHPDAAFGRPGVLEAAASDGTPLEHDRQRGGHLGWVAAADIGCGVGRGASWFERPNPSFQGILARPLSPSLITTNQTCCRPIGAAGLSSQRSTACSTQTRRLCQDDRLGTLPWVETLVTQAPKGVYRRL